LRANEIARKEVLFIHGGGDGGYEADEELAASLRKHLGANYNVRYPKMPADTASPDFGWGEKIGSQIAAIPGEILLVGHSLGASMLLKYLTENEVPHRIRGVFLLATPFWSGGEDWQKGLKLREDFTSALPKDLPIFFYHSRDDKEIAISHLAAYETKLPQAVIRVPATGGHQFKNDLRIVARDIRRLS
jgi:predicted alpha/beta hydrolase family esterase